MNCLAADRLDSEDKRKLQFLDRDITAIVVNNLISDIQSYTNESKFPSPILNYKEALQNFNNMRGYKVPRVAGKYIIFSFSIKYFCL